MSLGRGKTKFIVTVKKKFRLSRKNAIFPHGFFLYSFPIQTTLSCKSRVPKFCLIQFAVAAFLSSDTTDVQLSSKCERSWQYDPTKSNEKEKKQTCYNNTVSYWGANSPVELYMASEQLKSWKYSSDFIYSHTTE